MTEQDSAQNTAEHIDRLLDAIDLVKENRRAEARHLLRELIQENTNFEDAWLWMSVAVDSIDQSSICLDNVLRVNPKNAEAASALYRITIPEIEMEKRRSQLRFYRDFALGALWLVIGFILFTAVAGLVSLTT